MKKLLFLVAILAMCQIAFAVPAKPGTIRVVQGDGSELNIVLHGDEFFHYVLTNDGYQVTQHTDGNYYYYAPMSTRSNVRVQAHNAGYRDAAERAFLSTVSVGVDASYMGQGSSTAAATRLAMSMIAPTRALTMSRDTKAEAETKAELAPKGLVIVVQYPDVLLQPGRTIADFTTLLNQSGYRLNGGTGSARDYFQAASKGKYNPEFVVCPQIITLPHNRAYYGGNDAAGSDLHPREMIVDACRGADTYINFADYDTDGDGKLDNVFVYYAGHNEAEGAAAESIWPHRWVLGNTTLVLDGVQVYDYACTSELRSNAGGTLAGIGTFVHEFGHVLGLPDFYDTDGAGSGGSSPGLYAISVMCSGSYNNDGCTPPTYNAIERALVGWNHFLELKSNKTYTLDPINIANDAYVIPATDDAEFYVIEARDGRKDWDLYLKANGGLLIYRIDQSKNHKIINNDSAYDMWVYSKVNTVPQKECAKLIEAGGYNINARASQDGLFYPGSNNVSKFGSLSYGGIDSDNVPVRIELYDITFSAGKVSFKTKSSRLEYPSISLRKSAFSVGDTFDAIIKNEQDDIQTVSWIVNDVKLSDGDKYTFDKVGKTSIVCKIKYDDESEEVITRIVNVF